MKKQIYNLEFEAWCNEFTVYGYRFYRVDDYGQKVIMLQHRASGIDEFELITTTGKHVSTAYVDLPEIEEKAVLEWADSKATALQDIVLLLTRVWRHNFPIPYSTRFVALSHKFVVLNN